MTRVSFLCQSAFSTIGGLQQFNARFIRALDSIGSERVIDPQVFILNDEKKDVPHLLREMVSSARYGWFSFLIKLFLAAFKSDVFVIGHVNLLPIAIIVKLLRPKTRIVLIGHGIEVWPDAGHRKKRIVDSVVLKTCINEFWGVSMYTVNIFCCAFNFSKMNCRVFPNAVDVNDNEDDTHSPDGLRLVTVTRLGLSERDKNVDKVIHAVGLLIKRGYDVKFDIVGAGQLVDEYRTLVLDLGLQEVVTLHGFVANAVRKKICNESLIFVLPSTKEGFGIVYLEAWLSGLAVIGVNAGGVPEVVLNGVDGLITDSPDPELLADAIMFYIENPELRARHCENGLNKVKNLYSNEAFVRRLDEFLKLGRLS